MELQTLASFGSTIRDRFLRAQQRLGTALPFLCIEDLILMTTLLGAAPDQRALGIGGVISGVALLLLFWVQGYTSATPEPGIIGPFRFVRHPLRLSLWLLAIGLSLGARSFPGLLLSLGLLPLLYYLDLYHEDIERRRQNLAAVRYGKFVPALVPTIFPYRRDKTPAAFSWRSGIFGTDRSIRRRLARLLLGWILIVLLERHILPEKAAWIAAGLWLVYLLIRTILHRKTVRLVFS
jgi:protein-S-isoprenylcysteine O-methyltransferase Ste14